MEQDQDLGLRSFQRPPGMVTRLRIVFLSVSLVLIAAMVMGLAQMRNLTGSTDQLTEQSVPIFARTQEIGRNLKNILIGLQDVNQVQQISDLAPLEAALRSLVENLNSDIGALRDRGSPEDVIEQMAKSLEDIEESASRFFRAKRNVLLYALTLNQTKVFVEETRRALRDALAGLMQGIPPSARRPVVPGTDPFLWHEADHPSAHHLQQTDTLNKLMHELEIIINTAVQLDDIPDADELDATIADMRRWVPGIAALIARLEPAPARQDIAQEFAEIWRLVFGDMGIVEQIKLSRAEHAVLQEYQAAKISPILQIFDLSSRLTKTARIGVAQARENLFSASHQMVAVLIGMSAFSLFVFGVASLLIVERQINQRMPKLTRAVAAIAAGDTTYDVDVQGTDELSEMAKALETFKSNAQELRRSNAELEKFAYAAAHDLRSPLRAIQNLAEWTIEDEENMFSDESQQNMTLLQSQVNRLNMLLSDLLSYSRVGQEQEDLAQLSVESVVSSLGEMLDPFNRFNIRYSGPRSDIVTYATPLRQILLNLISNSIKHHDRDHGNISISCQLKPGRLHVSVRDDGPGITPQYHDRIFGLFQTLRPRDEIEGSGLGLSIIRKLIEHYGGAIRVESDPALARGAVFLFDLPEKSDAAAMQDRAA